MKLLLVFFLAAPCCSLTFSDSDSSCSSSDSSSSSSSSSESSEGHHHHGKPGKPNKPRGGTCLPGWHRFDRPSGGWCVQVFEGVMNQPQSEAACNKWGARLTGVENDNERVTIEKMGLELMQQVSSYNHGTMRFGLQRYNLQSPFLNTDGHTIGVGGLKWDVGQPAQYHTGGKVVRNCGMMWILATNPVASGKFISISCDITWNDQFRSYACGRVAD